MPSISTLPGPSKSKVKAALPSSTYKILTATVGRLYAAYPDPNQWSYTGIEGAVAFVRNLNVNPSVPSGTGSEAPFAFKIVDIKGTRGVIWDWQVELKPEAFEYFNDRGFLHTFAGTECMLAFSFANETEAAELYKKVNSRSKYAKAKTPSSRKTKSGGTGKIDKSMISGPSGFKHVAHMGYSSEAGFASAGDVDPSWQQLLAQLSGLGVSEKDIKKNEGFIRGPPPPPPPPPSAGAAAPPAPQGRNDLLASIQGQSVARLKKTPGPNTGGALATGAVVGAGLGAAGAAAAADDDGGGLGGPDLASALAAALSQRKGNMGDSDGEDSEDDCFKFLLPSANTSSFHTSLLSKLFNLMSFQVNTPAVLIQCQPYNIAWTGGLAPFYPVITRGGDIGDVIENFGEQEGKQVLWRVDQPVGDTVTFVITDSQGETATSGSSPAIVKGTTDDCMKKDKEDKPTEKEELKPAPAPSNTTGPSTHGHPSSPKNSTSPATPTSNSNSTSTLPKTGETAGKPNDADNNAAPPKPSDVGADTTARPSTPSDASSAQPSSKLVRSSALALLLLGVAGLVTLTL
ncbi:unnamed protein product [Tilletia controversa]|nr:unnamed protein product [Tilletia controversa]